MENPLSKLALDYWYQVLMVVGIIVFLLAGTGLLKAFPVIPVTAVSLGTFFFGMGEWINHPLQSKLLRATMFQPGGVITGHPRNATIAGYFFDLLGIFLIGLGCYKFIM